MEIIWSSSPWQWKTGVSIFSSIFGTKSPNEEKTSLRMFCAVFWPKSFSHVNLSFFVKSISLKKGKRLQIAIRKITIIFWPKFRQIVIRGMWLHIYFCNSVWESCLPVDRLHEMSSMISRIFGEICSRIEYDASLEVNEIPFILKLSFNISITR